MDTKLPKLIGLSTLFLFAIGQRKAAGVTLGVTAAALWFYYLGAKAAAPSVVAGPFGSLQR